MKPSGIQDDTEVLFLLRICVNLALNFFFFFFGLSKTLSDTLKPGLVISLREAFLFLGGLSESSTLVAAFYGCPHCTVFGALPTTSDHLHHNGTGRTRQHTVAQFLSQHRRWIISICHFAKE